MSALPTGVISLRSSLNFNEGPLRFGVPRPDSRNNRFCLSCHTSNDPVPALNTQALGPLVGVPLEDDVRRQPFQPPPRFRGHLPPMLLRDKTEQQIPTDEDMYKTDAFVNWYSGPISPRRLPN